MSAILKCMHRSLGYCDSANDIGEFMCLFRTHDVSLYLLSTRGTLNKK